MEDLHTKLVRAFNAMPTLTIDGYGTSPVDGEVDTFRREPPPRDCNCRSPKTCRKFWHERALLEQSFDAAGRVVELIATAPKRKTGFNKDTSSYGAKHTLAHVIGYVAHGAFMLGAVAGGCRIETPNQHSSAWLNITGEWLKWMRNKDNPRLPKHQRRKPRGWEPTGLHAPNY